MEKEIFNGNKKRVLQIGCGSKTDDYLGVCSKCRSGHAHHFEHGRKEISIEELQHRETLDEVYLDMEEGWPYKD